MVITPKKIENALNLLNLKDGFLDFFSVQEYNRLLEYFSQISKSDNALLTPEKITELFENEFRPTDIRNYFYNFKIGAFVKLLASDAPADSAALDVEIWQNIDPELNIADLKPAEILQLQNFETIKYLAFKTLENYDQQSANVLASILEKKLSEGFRLGLNKENVGAKMLRVYDYWALRLELFGFAHLQDAIKNDLFKLKTLAITGYGFDMKNILEDYFTPLTDDLIKKMCGEFSKSLLASQEVLGESNDFSTSGFRPTISNWLTEYQRVLNIKNSSSAITNDSGAFFIVKFSNTSQYIKFLKPDKQRILKSILDLYNWLLSPIIEEAHLGAARLINSQKFELPEQLASSYSGKAQPVVPVSSSQKPVKPIQEIIKKPTKEKAFGNEYDEETVEKLKQVYTPAKRAEMPSVRPVNIQDLLKNKEGQGNGHSAGLRIGDAPFGGVAPQGSVNNPALAINKQSTPDIDKKLEELKKKIKP